MRGLPYHELRGLRHSGALSTLLQLKVWLLTIGRWFTTHTPVPAGFDAFVPAMIQRYLRHYAEHLLGIGINDLMALGRKNPADSTAPFNMANLAIRGSGVANAVSRLHGTVGSSAPGPNCRLSPDQGSVAQPDQCGSVDPPGCLRRSPLALP